MQNTEGMDSQVKYIFTVPRPSPQGNHRIHHLVNWIYLVLESIGTARNSLVPEKSSDNAGTTAQYQTSCCIEQERRNGGSQAEQKRCVKSGSTPIDLRPTNELHDMKDERTRRFQGSGAEH